MKKILLLSALATPMAFACGVCVEDKVAATYDYAALQRALTHGQVVVFCEIRGRADAARVRQAVARVRSLDPASVRISTEPAAVSFALDARTSPLLALAQLQRGMPAGTHLTILRLATADGLQEVAR